MNFLLIIAGAVLIPAIWLFLRNRTLKSQAARGARYRAPRSSSQDARPTLSERLARSGRSRPTPPSAAAPILLCVTLAFLGLWLARAYFMPVAEPAAAQPAAPPEPSAPEPPTPGPPAPEPQAAALSGRLSAADSPAAATAGDARPAPPQAPAEGEALRRAAVAASSGAGLSQVGLMPTNPSAAAPARAAAPAPQGSAAAPSPRAPAASAPTPNPAPAGGAGRPAPAADNGLVRILSGAPPVPPAAPPQSAPQLTPKPAGRPGLLSDSGGFTVHLGSFADQSNAEKFKARLTAAGEAAVISEVTMDGRRWYRVLSGRFSSRGEADAHGRDLRRRGLTDDTGPYIVKPLLGGSN